MREIGQRCPPAQIILYQFCSRSLALLANEKFAGEAAGAATQSVLLQHRRHYGAISVQTGGGRRFTPLPFLRIRQHPAARGLRGKRGRGEQVCLIKWRWVRQTHDAFVPSCP